MANIIRSALVQTAWTGDKDSMVDKNVEYAKQAAEDGARIMCFQELFNAPYFCQVEENEHLGTAEAGPGRARPCNACSPWPRKPKW